MTGLELSILSLTAYLNTPSHLSVSLSLQGPAQSPSVQLSYISH